MLSWLPESVSSYGAQIDQLFYVIYYVTGVTFFLVQGALVAFMLMYRHREGRRATYTHGNTALEIAWTIAPAVLLVILGVVSRSVWADIKQHVPPSDVFVQDAWSRGHDLSVHGWVYSLSNGLITDLNVTVSRPEEVKRLG